MGNATLSLTGKIKAKVFSVDVAIGTHHIYYREVVLLKDVLKLLAPHMKNYERLQVSHGALILDKRRLELKHEALMVHLQPENRPNPKKHFLGGYRVALSMWFEELDKLMGVTK